MSEQTNTITVGECKEFVIVHDGVHIFDPNGINITIENDPSALLLSRCLVLVGILESFGKKSIRPVSAVRIKDTIELVQSDHLGVDGVKSSGDTSLFFQGRGEDIEDDTLT
jgi:hypothetical protein